MLGGFCGNQIKRRSRMVLPLEMTFNEFNEWPMGGGLVLRHRREKIEWERFECIRP
jgi:hypothetical protein